tara:strand:- start:66 stop:821 length:756 start_codon:yes stop_codon:yes gene_type:complete
VVSFLLCDSQLTLYITDYTFQTLFWAVEASGVLDVTVHAEDVPTSSPLQLNTGNKLMLSIAPGLGQYNNTPMFAQVRRYCRSTSLWLLFPPPYFSCPGCSMFFVILSQVSVSPYANTTDVTVTSKGVESKNNTFLTNYYLADGSNTLLFTLLQELVVDFSVALGKGDLSLSVTKLRVSSTDCTYTSVGRVNGILATTYFNTGVTDLYTLYIRLVILVYVCSMRLLSSIQYSRSMSYSIINDGSALQLLSLI